MASKKSTIKVGSVTLPIYPHAKGWRVAWKNDKGIWKYITRKDRSEAVEEGRKKARELNNGVVDLASLDPARASILRRVLDLNMTHADLDEWESSRGRAKVPLSAAVTEFLAAKEGIKGHSGKNVSTLTKALNTLSRHLGDKHIAEVSLSDLDTWLAPYKAKSPRTRKNLRGACVTFFRWCRTREYLPDKTTVAEKMERPIVPKKVPSTYTPAQMRLLLDGCQKIAPDYLPWLVLAGFGGVRQEELIPDNGSTKPPLDWSDFHWERDIIIMRPETAKTGDRRVIPIHPVIKAWLYDRRKDCGPVCPQYAPFRSVDRSSPTLTKRLGDLVGGWKINALRHSSISFRAAIVGLAQAAMEHGNSESEARKSYNDAKGKDEALEWFSLFPLEPIGTK